ncbi:unnamed protein product [Didymodactylos carnosus]|uniref:DDE-1 domain-containing protein n=1 Tax=Didymodactylos carnosus TaxID=1234261 RepID=A0A815RSN1_9BILA|nr:unnamed protein product [Didymodactylos carnosus]CAF4345086.1 unnamed protein product [Didymodactylos carnosus]
MGEMVKRGLFEPKNVVITCSSSGKLTSSLVRYWRDHCLLPFVGNKSLLLSDSWPGQGDEDLYTKEGCGGKLVQRLAIPPKTTSDLQPLDCYTNRQIKNFIKKCHQRFSIYVLLSGLFLYVQSTFDDSTTTFSTLSLPSNDASIDYRILPYVGNGHIATVVLSNSVYMNGIYNGENGTSHRARIPSTHNWYIRSPSRSNFTKSLYTLNVSAGVQMLVMPDALELLE